MRALLLAVAFSLAPIALRGQEATDPRAVRPERSTVATHASIVEPRYLELDTGVERDRNPEDGRSTSARSSACGSRSLMSRTSGWSTTWGASENSGPDSRRIRGWRWPESSSPQARSQQ